MPRYDLSGGNLTEYILDIIESLIYIYEEVFWLKECFMAAKSIFVFFLVWLITKLDYRQELFLYLGAFIGVICIFFGDIGYLSDNDVLKLIAPASLYLLTYYQNRDSDLVLCMFLVPYFITSYEFYRSFPVVIQSIISHTLIIFSISIAKDNRYLSLSLSVLIGILINLIGYNSPPGTNDVLVNPALITLATKGLEFYSKNSKYTDFLKSFWATLLCFAFFGSWIFHHIKPLSPTYFRH